MTRAIALGVFLGGAGGFFMTAFTDRPWQSFLAVLLVGFGVIALALSERRK